MSFLGLDVGEKRIGVARSDELNTMAHAEGFIEFKSREHVLHEVERIMKEGFVEGVVIGLPKTLEGDVGPAAEKALEFQRWLAAQIPCPVIVWDERLTTAQAERVLIGHDVSRAKRRVKRDAMAASIMLQSYLDFRKRKGN